MFVDDKSNMLVFGKADLEEACDNAKFAANFT